MTLQSSASKSDLLLQCARPFEQGVDTDDEPGEAALYGSAFHELMEFENNKSDALLKVAIKLERKWNIPGASDELVGHVRSARELLYKWERGANPWGTNFTKPPYNPPIKEQAYAIDPSALTCRRIDSPSVEDHIYIDIKPTEIPGTVDRLTLGPVPILLDYKTGRDPFDFLTVPEDVTQLRTLGLAAWFDGRRVTKVEPMEVILAVLHAPRGSVPAIYADLVPVSDLRKHAAVLADALRRRGDGSLRAGPCCRFCPARRDCVTQTGAYLAGAAQALELATPSGNVMAELVEYGQKNLGLFGGATEITLAEDVGRLHYFVKQFEKLSKSVSPMMRNWVIEHPEDIAIRPDGKVLIIKTKSQENLSKASIIRALGKLRGEALIAELRENGVIETSEREELHAVDDK